MRCGQFGRHAIEQGILLALEVGDRTQQTVAVAGVGVGVPLRLTSAGVGERRLGDQGAHPSLVGLIDHELELLGGDGGLGAQPLETVGDVDEAAFEQRARHSGGSLRARGGPCLPETAYIGQALRADVRQESGIVATEWHPPAGSRPSAGERTVRRRRRLAIAAPIALILGVDTWYASQNLFCGVSWARRYSIPSQGMYPTVRAGDRIRVIDDSSIERGDVIVFAPPGGAISEPAPESVLKRVVAVGGDRIEADDGDIVVNGVRVEERYRNPECGDFAGIELEPRVIPLGSVYVLGDNRCESMDSRAYGPVSLDSIVGRVCGGDLRDPS